MKATTLTKEQMTEKNIESTKAKIERAKNFASLLRSVKEESEFVASELLTRNI